MKHPIKNPIAKPQLLGTVEAVTWQGQLHTNNKYELEVAPLSSSDISLQNKDRFEPSTIIPSFSWLILWPHKGQKNKKNPETEAHSIEGALGLRRTCYPAW